MFGTDGPPDLVVRLFFEFLEAAVTELLVVGQRVDRVQLGFFCGIEQVGPVTEGALEAREGLEQLRFLENGVRVRCVPVEARGAVFWELNNPEDVPKLEAMMAQMGLD